MRKTAALCSLAAVTLFCLGSMPGDADPRTNKQVTVTIYFGPQARPTIEKTIPVEAGATAMDAVRKAARVETNSEGTFLIAMEGVANNVDGKEFWIYFVNGEAQHVSAAQKKLKARDRVLWFLRKSGAPSHVER